MTKEEAKYPCEGCYATYCYKNCDFFSIWLGRAEAALSKQVPQKVVDMVADGEFICPSCHNSVPYWATYCPDCGQRLE